MSNPVSFSGVSNSQGSDFTPLTLNDLPTTEPYATLISVVLTFDISRSGGGSNAEVFVTCCGHKLRLYEDFPKNSTKSLSINLCATDAGSLISYNFGVGTMTYIDGSKTLGIKVYHDYWLFGASKWTISNVKITANYTRHSHTGGSAATCTTPQTCTVCGSTIQSALGHAPGAAATCTTSQTCTRCGATLANSLGHIWGETTYSWSADNTSFTATRRCTRDSSHFETANAITMSKIAEYPTCTQMGTTEYFAYFENVDWAYGQTKTVQDIPMNDHTWNDATCTEPETCTTCNTTNGDPLGHIWSEATCINSQICERCGHTGEPALGHLWIDATCTSVKTCSRCGVTQGNALGHDWGETEYIWTEDYKNCTAKRVCNRSNCGHTEFSIGVIEDSVYIEATCTKGGIIDRTAIFDVPWAVDSFIEVETPPNGHKFYTEIGDVLEPGCDYDGFYNEYTICSVCNYVKSVTSYRPSALGHDCSIKETIKPTISTYGYTEHKCTRCPYSYKDSYTCMIGLSANNGIITGAEDGSIYERGTQLCLTAEANPGYEFIKWSDGDTSNPKYFYLNNSELYTAIFGIRKIFLGIDKFKDLYIGTDLIKNVYIGTKKIYE